jgi:hypothetical protein
LYNAHSYAGAEYAGALAWYGQGMRQRQKLQNQISQAPLSPVPGLLPTWAIVQDQKRPLLPWSNNKRTRRRGGENNNKLLLNGSPHPDPSVVGVLMPIQTSGFQSLKDSKTLKAVTATSSQLAAVMLPAARGLAYCKNMGIALRDLVEKNFAFLHVDKKQNNNDASSKQQLAAII